MRIILTFIFFLLVPGLNAQTNTYLADLTALRAIIEKTASFRAQVKGDKLTAYNDLYHRLLSDSSMKPDSYEYFYNLAQLVFPLRDNHLGFYQLPDYQHLSTTESIDSFVATKELPAYPACKINLDSLKANLATRPADAIEGIYYYDKFYTVGLFKSEAHKYVGVVLDSDISLWKKGQVAIHLYEFGPNLYKAIYGHPKFKFFMLQPVEKYQNQSLINASFYGSYSQSVYTKQLTQTDYVRLPKTASKFALKNLQDDVQYLLIQTFQANHATAAVSQEFYDSVKTLLKAPHLVVDLRNNEGGAEKEMKKYLRLLQQYVNNGHLYVLVNNGTLSQAEIFTLELKKLANVTTVGQQTKGMLAYGSNYGKREKLPSGKFELYLTDMNNGATLLQYEDYGIQPDILLQNDKDWLDQVLEIIRGK
ncbi:hypothetical protein I5907_00070 [Panacibacter sp. DH6]|uniref:Tail specific protease domain-containing protein n=1 Tax=Panacibacter microcysteis TaxID=2793269 RepID=A0A931E1Y3_9BACT|nr:S41 family peptidase [Panacibacter microcysteis]MBG9374612.1 hypothetical protein [Panacibacter microcysteis]